jgi:MarR family transcriptional regulator, organic hydroperoxide resistance regulator
MNSRKIIAVISSIRGLAHELISRELKRHGISGIAPSHGDILFTLYSKDGVSMKEIARGIGKKKNTVTVLVDKLASLGFVRKEADGADRRTTRVFLTEKARAFQGVFADVSETLIERTLKDFGEPEKDGLMTFLDRIEKNLK